MNDLEIRRTLAEGLRAQRERYPAMEDGDAVKYVFQAMLGVGHLLGERDTVAARAADEMAGLSPDPAEPLTEPVGPAWARLNLRRAKAEGLTPQAVAGLMLSSGAALAYTRQQVADACAGLGIAPEALSNVLDERWLPSHSPAYRAQYAPAYRLIAADWTPLLKAVAAISRRQADAQRVLVTLDGPCATGKTTLAARLAEVFRAGVLHTDDFVIPHAQKTPERLAIPGGNCDAERLAQEAVAPWKRGGSARFRRYDWTLRALLPAEVLPPCDTLILEGSYCNLPALRAYADVRLFLTAPWPLREARLRRRESPASFRRFLDLWIPLEDAYFDAYRLPDEGCVVIGAEPGGPDGNVERVP